MRTFSLFAWLLLAATVARAHPLHLSVSEANYNRDTGRLEIALRCFPDDLATALSRAADHAIEVSKPENIAAAALDYLRSTWRVTDTKGKLQALSWGGVDVTDSHIFLFFEVSLPQGLAGARFQNTFMHDLFADQLNSVQLRDGGFKQTLLFARGDGAKTVSAPR